MLVSIEQHVDWVSDCIKWMKAEGKATIEPSDSAEQEWAEHTEQLANMTLYPKANSWYMGSNVPGKLQNVLGLCGWRRNLPTYLRSGGRRWVSGVSRLPRRYTYERLMKARQLPGLLYLC